jgi:hypothetical protein
VFELLVHGLRLIVLALQIDASEKFDCVVYEMRDVACVLVQGGMSGERLMNQLRGKVTPCKERCPVVNR